MTLSGSDLEITPQALTLLAAGALTLPVYWTVRRARRGWSAVHASERLRHATLLALGHPRAQDLLADVLDLDGAGLVRQVRERRLLGDEPVQQVLLVVLEADVEHVRLAARGDVARHLEGHRGLARALGAAEEQQLPRTEAGADGLVERGEAERDRLVFADPRRWEMR